MPEINKLIDWLIKLKLLSGCLCDVGSAVALYDCAGGCHKWRDASGRRQT